MVLGLCVENLLLYSFGALANGRGLKPRVSDRQAASMVSITMVAKNSFPVNELLKVRLDRDSYQNLQHTHTQPHQAHEL